LHKVRPLPSCLINRFQGWRDTACIENKARYRRLASGDQHPRWMIMLRQRVSVTSIFGAGAGAGACAGAGDGEFFIHRSISYLVPPIHTMANATAPRSPCNML